MIGNTANIVALGMLEKEFGFYMKFFKWLSIELLGDVLPLPVILLVFLESGLIAKDYQIFPCARTP